MGTKRDSKDFRAYENKYCRTESKSTLDDRSQKASRSYRSCSEKIYKFAVFSKLRVL